MSLESLEQYAYHNETVKKSEKENINHLLTLFTVAIGYKRGILFQWGKIWNPSWQLT